MKHFRCAFAIALGLWAAPAFSATYWVGSSAACTGSSVRVSLNAALLSAAFNAGSDEIRLTNTLTYSGSNGTATLTDWDPGAAGSLTISGGYPDCFTSPSGRTNFGNTTGTAVTVQTSSQPQSNVTLRRLNIRSADTGLVATGGASVILDDVRIGDHDMRGIFVDGGAYVDIQTDSIVEENGDRSTGSNFGGNVYCNGANSEVTLSGQLRAGSAVRGSGAYLSNGCFMMLLGGSSISGGGAIGDYGGGVYVDTGGELFSNGGGQRVTIAENFGWLGGGGIYVNGTGRVTLVNTYLKSNWSLGPGAAIYAVNGGTAGSAQVTMDRASECPFLISCSEIEGSRGDSSTVYVNNSFVRISRTILELNQSWTINPDFMSLIHGTNGALVRLGHVGMYQNTTNTVIWNQGAQFEIQHATIARNVVYVDSGTPPPSGALLQQGASTASTIIQKSIIADTSGFDLQSGVVGTPCLLLDGAAGDLSPSFYYSGTAQFINAASGDFRQTSASPGVDMCNGTSSFFWASTRDIEYQTLPVNDANNDQGSPGQADGYYDAGYDENHLNVGEDYFTLTAAKQGDGSGSIVSVPLGIACGSDCNEDYFNGTLVELYANASTGSVFDGWLGCPLSSGNVCFISVTQDTTVTARFAGTSPGDEIFADSFEASL